MKKMHMDCAPSHKVHPVLILLSLGYMPDVADKSLTCGPTANNPSNHLHQPEHEMCFLFLFAGHAA